MLEHWLLLCMRRVSCRHGLLLRHDLNRLRRRGIVTIVVAVVANRPRTHLYKRILAQVQYRVASLM